MKTLTHARQVEYRSAPALLRDWRSTYPSKNAV